MKTRRFLEFLVACGAIAATAHGQSVISARSGVIHHADGNVYLGEKLVQPKFGEFPNMTPDSVLRSDEGRAEVLLTPGVFLRMGENSAFKLVANKLEDTQVEFLNGSVLIEVVEMLEDNAVAISYKGYSFSPKKAGLFRLDAEPARLRVYDGEVIARASGNEVKVKEGREMALDGGVELAKFDSQAGDPLYRWSKRRAGYLAMANLPASKSLADAGRRYSGWFYNPYFGMMTYIPFGFVNSPFGYSFYGPRYVYRAYAPPPVYTGGGAGGTGGMGMYNPNLGYNTVGRSVNTAPSVSSGASSGGGYSAGAAGGGASPARTSDSAVGRGDSGGRGR